LQVQRLFLALVCSALLSRHSPRFFTHQDFSRARSRAFDGIRHLLLD
jgi:hypothetical protein